MGLFSATAIVMGSMIGSGIFIVSAEMSRAAGIAGAADCGVAGDGGDDDHRRAELWRAGGDDAEGRRAVCVSARGAGAAVGISLWVDAVSGDSDGDDCGGGGGVREVSWGVLSECERVELDLAYRACSGVACGADGAGQYGHWVEYGEPGRRLW